jgi:hypothetical protein
MITVNKTTLEATAGAVATAEQALLISPNDISKNFNLKQMQALAVKYLGKEFEKGTTKAAACETLFSKFCELTGIDYAAIKAENAKKIEEEKAAREAAKAAAKAEKTANRASGVRKSWSKTYILTKGRKPENTAEKREMVWGSHADIICEAITTLIDSGKTEATREEIMDEAVKQGLYEKHKSTQNVAAIFSWWRKGLNVCGWLESKVEIAAPAVTPAVAEAPKS